MSKDCGLSISESSAMGERIGIHEGSIGMPVDYEDRTANLFVPADPQSQPNLSIARDWLRPEEDLASYVDRQCGKLKKRLPGFRLLNRDNIFLRWGTSSVQGIVINTSYKQGQQQCWQRQAGFLIAPRRVLIFTASLLHAPDEKFEAFWSDWIGSFQLDDSFCPPPEMNPS